MMKFLIELSPVFQQEGQLNVERGIIIRIVSKPRFSKFTAQRIVEHLLFKRR